MSVEPERGDIATDHVRACGAHYADHDPAARDVLEHVKGAGVGAGHSAGHVVVPVLDRAIRIVGQPQVREEAGQGEPETPAELFDVEAGQPVTLEYGARGAPGTIEVADKGPIPVAKQDRIDLARQVRYNNLRTPARAGPPLTRRTLIPSPILDKCVDLNFFFVRELRFERPHGRFVTFAVNRHFQNAAFGFTFERFPALFAFFCFIGEREDHLHFIDDGNFTEHCSLDAYRRATAGRFKKLFRFSGRRQAHPHRSGGFVEPSEKTFHGIHDDFPFGRTGRRAFRARSNVFTSGQFNRDAGHVFGAEVFSRCSLFFACQLFAMCRFDRAFRFCRGFSGKVGFRESRRPFVISFDGRFRAAGYFVFAGAGRDFFASADFYRVAGVCELVGFRWRTRARGSHDRHVDLAQAR
jgi:hypothetical protein